MLPPEIKARQRIDQMLEKAGWVIQDYKALNPGAGLGVAVREYQTERGPADYVLLVDRKPVGVIEAKRPKEGERLNVHEGQAEDYATSKLKWTIDQQDLPFVYVSTGEITKHWDLRDPKPRSREVFWFHRPETLQRYLKEENSFRQRLTEFPSLDTDGLRECQINAIGNLEQSFMQNKPRALIQMATGSGKTFTAVTSIYRLLKEPIKAKRILFLVDTKNLGEQAESAFQKFTPNDDKRKFTELYTVQRLSSGYIDPAAQVCISTIQRMYSILKGEELDESMEQENPNEGRIIKEPVPVDYNPEVPIEMFDLIVIDECHRSIYNLWRQVLEYYDAFLIGLTATPDNRTYAFFNENVVSEYTHEEAVADGVNVGYDEYIIETKVGTEGGKIEAQQHIDIRNRMTRKKRWEQADEDIEYTKRQLDRDIVNPSQIRTVVREFKRALKNEIFPKRNEVPKTLVFAKTDSHANDIIEIMREEFGEGNDFCKKVTYQSEEDPKSILASFRNSYNPRIAVTVDMIATGTDIQPLECLLFMRDVKSRNYFEQMKGRGTRIIDADSLQKVTPSAATRKSHFIIVDAVGVLKSLKTDSRPLERKKGVSMKELMNMVVMGQTDEDTLMSLANRITRMEKQMDDKEKETFKEKSGGKSINKVVHELLDAHDPDKIAASNKSAEEIAQEATKVFDQPEFREYVENVRKNIEQIIDTHNRDEVIFSGFDKQAKEKAQAAVNAFKQFLNDKREELIALRIFYNEPFRRKEITFKMIQELHDALMAPPYNLTVERIWNAYHTSSSSSSSSPSKGEVADRRSDGGVPSHAPSSSSSSPSQGEVADRRSDGGVPKPATQNPAPKHHSPTRMLTDIISLIRFELGEDQQLRPYADVVRKNFQDWVFKKQAGATKFNEAQVKWLHLVRDHIMASMHLDRDDLELGRMGQEGGLAKMYQLFGQDMAGIIEEMNEVLAA